MNKSTIDQVYVKELDTLFDINDIRVPSVGTGDAGKTLSVGSDGRYTLAEQSASVSSLTDVEIGTLADGQVLQYDSTSGKWVNAENSGGVMTIGSLADVAIGTLSDGDVLTYDQTQGVWIGTAASGGTSIIMRTWTNS